MAAFYTTKTASIKTIKADINELNSRKIKVNGKDVATSVKHPDDDREIITENDLWSNYAEITSDGEIVFHDDDIISSGVWNANIIKVEDNKAYTAEGFFANVQTDKIKDGNSMFSGYAGLTFFNASVTSLINAENMFAGCSNLASFASPLGSLTNGSGMFSACSKLTTFSANLSSLTEGTNMFNGSKLNPRSIASIIHFLPTHATGGTITLGIGINNNAAAKETFAKECYADSWESLQAEFSAKNWAPEWQFNGPAA